MHKLITKNQSSKNTKRGSTWRASLWLFLLCGLLLQNGCSGCGEKKKAAEVAAVDTPPEISEPTPPPTEPSSPPNLVPAPLSFAITEMIPSNNQLTVKWSASQNATHYHLYYRDVGGGGDFIKITDVTSPYALISLTDGLNYEIKMEAQNTVGSIFSSPMAGTPRSPVQVNAVTFINPHNALSGTATSTSQHKLELSLEAYSQAKSQSSPRGFKLYLNSQGVLNSGGEE